MTTAQIDSMFIGTRRRLLSSDFNDGERLSQRALVEAVSALALQGDYKKVVAGRGGVIAGFEVTALPASNSVRVGPGIALIASAPDDSLLDPPLVWVEQRTSFDLDLGPYVDFVNPRLVTIEVAGAFASKTNSVVQVFDPNTGNFGVAAQDIVIGNTPAITANVGVAAAAPVVAPGPVASGSLPLAVVKLSTGQASFTDPFVSVLMCRPILLGPGFLLTIPRLALGGGISVGRQSGGVIVDLDRLKIGSATLELLGLPARVAGALNFPLARTKAATPPATLLGTAQPVYGYAAPPPWAPDYGDIAPREARSSNPNALDLAITPEAVILGDGSTFTSLSWLESGRRSGVQNAIVFFDAAAPVGLSIPSGGPAVVNDHRGPHPVTDAGGVFTLDPTQDPTWGASQTVGDSIYIGSVSSLGAGSFMAQSYQGSGSVLINDLRTARPSSTLVASTVGQVNFYPGHFPDMTQIADPEVLPDSGRSVTISGEILGTGGAGQLSLIIGSPLGWGGQNVVASNDGHWRASWNGTDAPNQQNISGSAIPVHRDNDGVGLLEFNETGANATALLALVGYHDIILSSR